MKPTFGSLFAGIGGMDLGLERAGWECRWQVENDPYCNRVLEKHWPNVQRFGDIREVKDLPSVDLIAGGFPCQSISIAGNQKGNKDENWLWPEYHRILRTIRSRWALIENVPGLLSIDAGQLFRGILWDLAESGYDAEWNHISAVAVGAQHRRNRVFVVAHSRSYGRPTSQIFRQSDPLRNQKSFGSQRNDGGIYCENFSGRLWCFPNTTIERKFDGFSDWMDRLRGLGNAVVPQVAEWIGAIILQSMEGK